MTTPIYLPRDAAAPVPSRRATLWRRFEAQGELNEADWAELAELNRLHGIATGYRIGVPGWITDRKTGKQRWSLSSTPK